MELFDKRINYLHFPTVKAHLLVCIENVTF